MIDFAKELNSEQLSVVKTGDGHCLVLAGAGSGKTRTITYRVAYLLEQGIKPENILLVTFTNKAAKEMLERVRLLVSGCRDAPPLRGVSTDNFHLPWAGTFHHIGYRLLKKYAEVLGYKNNFSVLDSEDSLALIKLCLKQEGIDRTEKRFPAPAVLQSIISYARNSETTIEDVLDLKYEHFLPISETLVRLAEDYQKRKLSANAMDFDDLLVNWYLLLLKNPQIKNKLAEQFQYILVDEYQDTNKIQASIIDLLASQHQNLLVVGDDAQSIYSFRAAEIANILAFEKKYKDAKIFKLEINYRSTPDILNLANNIISNNIKQYEKKLVSVCDNFTNTAFAKASSVKPELISFASQAEEAEFIVQRIKELESEGVELNKIAVLFRAAYHSQALEMELVKRGVDYDYRGGVRFFERAHIKDVLAYLRIINNIEDTVAWRRVLNMQVGIGEVNAERIVSVIARRSSRDDEAIPADVDEPEGLPHPARAGLAMTDFDGIGAQLPAKAQIGWSDFLQIYKKLTYIENKTPGGLITEILESKYVEYLENEYPDYRERLQDIEQLAMYAERNADSNAENTQIGLQNLLSRFLAEATLQENYNRSGITQNTMRTNVEDKIILSTIHQAKGLEWEAVFVLGLSAGQFPNDRALRERDGIEEERRLFYVAVTRAKKYLYLTYSLSSGFSAKGSSTSGWGDSFSGPSMFIEELNRELISAEGVEGGSVFEDDPEEIVYVSEDDDGIRNTNDTKLRNTKNNSARSFLKGLEEL